MNESSSIPPFPPFRPSSPLPGSPGGAHAPTRLPLALLGAAVSVLVILAVIGVRVVLPMALPAESGVVEDDPVGAMLFRVQGGYMVGAADMMPEGRETLLAQAEAIDVGPLTLRQRFVVLAAELGDATDGRRQLQELDELIGEARARDGYEPIEDDLAVMAVLDALYPSDTELAADVADAQRLERIASLPADDRDLLEARLGWFGTLAVTPRGSEPSSREAVLKMPRKLLVGVVTVFGVLAAAAVAGSIGLLVFIVLALTGRLAARVPRGAAPPVAMLETFALWLVLFFAMQLGAGLAAVAIGGGELIAAFVAFLASLVALAWLPARTGMPWSTLRREIGLEAGRGVSEPIVGVLCYVCGLPIVAIGIALTWVLLLVQSAMTAESGAIFDTASGPAHPIVGELGAGNVVVLVQILLIGSVAAPIVEETMFRGVLYRGLRDMTRGIGLVLSVAVATIVNTAIFALIHPQGLVAVPALMSLAVAFTLAREWRGTLVPSIVMHGVSNGIVLCVIFFLFSG